MCTNWRDLLDELESERWDVKTGDFETYVTWQGRDLLDFIRRHLNPAEETA